MSDDETRDEAVCACNIFTMIPCDKHTELDLYDLLAELNWQEYCEQMADDE